MKLRLLLTTLICSVVAGRPSVAAQPNILFIFSGDHAQHAISAYGSKVNQTPNIDRLAQGGARFINSFVTNSICTPSRATLLTGQYSHFNGVPVFNRFDGSRDNVAKHLQAGGCRQWRACNCAKSRCPKASAAACSPRPHSSPPRRMAWIPRPSCAASMCRRNSSAIGHLLAIQGGSRGAAPCMEQLFGKPFRWHGCARSNADSAFWKCGPWHPSILLHPQSNPAAPTTLTCHPL